MDRFWNDPNQIAASYNTEEVFPYSFAGFDVSEKGGDNSMNALGLHMSNTMNFGANVGGHGMHMPAAAASTPRTANHMPPPHLSQYDASEGFERFTVQNDQTPSSHNQQNLTHADQAASALLSMSSHSQEHPQPTAATGVNGGSWGNVNLANSGNFANDLLSGAPSSGSTTTPLTPTFTNDFQRPARATSQTQYHPQNMMPQGAQTGNFGHTRHPSLQIGNSNNHAYNSQLLPWQMSLVAMGGTGPEQSQRRAPMIRYGSDQNFGQEGYQATTFPASDDKYTNLLNVPLASQAARDAQVPIAGAQQVGGTRDIARQQRHSVPNSLQQLSSAALNHPYAPLQASSPTTQYSVGHFSSMHATGTNDEQQQSRKRRRSQAEDEEATSYTRSQTGFQNNSNAARRAPTVVPKQEPATDDHDALYATPATSSHKRRKSSARPGTASSSASASPSTPAERTLKTSSSKKRRSDPKQPRHNLSDTQKRNNHIASEQKRRDAMKSNYEELNIYVPSLGLGGTHGLSRSEILQHSADWLESLKLGNEAIMAAYGISLEDIMDDIAADRDVSND